MKDSIKNLAVNVDVAAAVYLSAKTEAITRHDQSHYFNKRDNPIDTANHPCGTSACLAGHAIIIDQGSYERAKSFAGRMKAVEAVRILIDGGNDFPVTGPGLYDEIKKLHENGEITTKERKRSTYCVSVLFNSFGAKLTSKAALIRFRKWVKKFSSKADYARFCDLIELDVDALYDEVNVPKTLIAA